MKKKVNIIDLIIIYKKNICIISFVLLLIIIIGFCWNCFNWGFKWSNFWVACASVATSVMVYFTFRSLQENKRQEIKKEKSLLLKTFMGVNTEMESLLERFLKNFQDDFDSIKDGKKNVLEVFMTRSYNNYFVFYDRNCHNLMLSDNRDLLKNIFLMYSESKALMDALIAYGEVEGGQNEFNTSVIINCFEDVNLYYSAVKKEIDIEIDNLKKSIT